jgi:fatty acid kinase fatty acid binding subunit
VAGGRVAIITDSASDLPTDLAASAGIRLVPLTVTFGSEAMLDGVDLLPDAFWDRLAEGPDLPTTASPSPEAFLQAYESAGRHAEGVVSVHLSGVLSRTADSARLAAGRASVRVEVVDTRSVSLGQGPVALAAARAAEDGADVAAEAETARSAVARLIVAAALDTVEFLRRGGRVGRIAAALSGLLRIRPVLGVEEGAPVLAARARTRAGALEEAVSRVAGPAEGAAVFHARAPEAPTVARRIARACGVEPIVGLIGAVTGAHLGPGAVGLAVLRPAPAGRRVD